MATLRLSLPTDYRRGNREELKLAESILQWSQKTLEEVNTYVHTLQRSFDEAGKGLFGSVHQSLTTLEVAIDNVCLRRRADQERAVIGKAFSQSLNDIWSEIGAFLSPGKKITEIMRRITALQEQASEAQAQFRHQLKQCEERIPLSQADSVETVNVWDTSVQHPARRIVSALRDCGAQDLETPRVLSAVQEILKECVGKRESVLVKDLEREVEKISWQADVLANCLRETQRTKGDPELKQHISVLEACNQSLRGELAAVYQLRSKDLEAFKFKVNEAYQDEIQELATQMNRRLQAQECQLAVLKERLRLVKKNTSKAADREDTSKPLCTDVATSISEPVLNLTTCTQLELPTTHSTDQIKELHDFIEKLQQDLQQKNEELAALQVSSQPEAVEKTSLAVQTELEAWKVEVMRLTETADETECLEKLEAAFSELKQWKDVGQTPQTTARQLTGSLQELEEEHALLSQENLDLLREVEELRLEKSTSGRLLADLQQTLKDVQEGWAQAKQRHEDLQSELYTAGQTPSDPEHIKRLLDDMEERDRELHHLKALSTSYRDQVAALKSQLQQKEEENASLEEQQSVALRELEELQRPADAVLLEAAHKAAELSLLQDKYVEEQGKSQQLTRDNKTLEHKVSTLKAALAELQSSERVLSQDVPRDQSLDFEEEAISCADPLTRSMSEEMRTLLGLSEEAEVCRKVTYSSREWVLVRLPRDALCWIQIGAAGTVTREQAIVIYDEVARLVHVYNLGADVTLAVARALCLLERAQLVPKVAPPGALQVSGLEPDSVRLKGLVLELLRVLPSLYLTHRPVEAEAVVRVLYSAIGLTE